jgi:hypothetical protein
MDGAKHARVSEGGKSERERKGLSCVGVCARLVWRVLGRRAAADEREDVAAEEHLADAHAAAGAAEVTTELRGGGGKRKSNERALSVARSVREGLRAVRCRAAPVRARARAPTHPRVCRARARCAPQGAWAASAAHERARKRLHDAA